MKKIFLILVLCLSTIGLTGCGNKLPKKVELTPENNYTAIVGQDLREGKEYYIVVEDYNKEDVGPGMSGYGNLIYVNVNNQNPPITITKDELLSSEKICKKRINVTKNDKIVYSPRLDSNHQTLASVLGENGKIYIVSE